MPSQRIHHRIERGRATVWAAFACADVVAEAVSRRLRHEIAEHLLDQAAEPDGRGDAAATPASIGLLFRLIGRAIARRCRPMLAADRAYDRARAELRARRLHRDQLAGRLYDRLVELRRRFGRHARRCLGLDGPTSRDPVELDLQGFQAVRLLSRPRLRLPSDLPAVGPIDPVATSKELEPLCAELEEAIRAVYRGQARVDGALFHQRRAIEDFDALHADGARLLERILDAAGLPTVRDLVRPGVGRRGRPPKVKPVDAYPDLVALALSRCAPQRGEVVKEAPAAGPASAAEARSPEEQQSAAVGDLREHPEGLSGVRSVDSPLPEGSEKSEQGRRKPAAGGEKTVHAVHKPPAGQEKIVRGVRKPRTDGEKVVQGVRKSSHSDISDLLTAFTASPPIRGCGHGRRSRRSDGPRRRRTGPERGERWSRDASALGRMRRAAVAWWQRMGRAA